jgi:hypothetical protein
MRPFALRTLTVGAALVIGATSMATADEPTRQVAQAKGNPCAAKNPCGAAAGAAVKDPAAEAAFRQYRACTRDRRRRDGDGRRGRGPRAFEDYPGR